jgi:hypothetical protein
MSRTLRAGARRRCRYAASWTSPARGALPVAGGDGEMSCSVEQRDGVWLWLRCLAVIWIEYCVALEQGACESEQPICDTADGAAVCVAAFT